MQRAQRITTVTPCPIYRQFLTPNAPASIVSLIIGQNFIPTTRVLQKAHHPELSLCLWPGVCDRRPRRRQLSFIRTAARTTAQGVICQRSTAQRGADPNPPRKAKLGRRRESVAPPSNDTRLIDNLQCSFLPVCCIVGAFFEYATLLVWIRNARRPSGFSVSRVANKDLYIFAFLQAAMMSARLLAYVFLSKKDIETLRCIYWNCAAFDSVRSNFPELSSCSVAKKAIPCVSSGFGVFSFIANKVELIHCVFAVLFD